jgi:hypothetical protein
VQRVSARVIHRVLLKTGKLSSLCTYVLGPNRFEFQAIDGRRRDLQTNEGKSRKHERYFVCNALATGFMQSWPRGWEMKDYIDLARRPFLYFFLAIRKGGKRSGYCSSRRETKSVRQKSVVPTRPQPTHPTHQTNQPVKKKETSVVGAKWPTKRSARKPFSGLTSCNVRPGAAWFQGYLHRVLLKTETSCLCTYRLQSPTLLEFRGNIADAIYIERSNSRAHERYFV